MNTNQLKVQLGEKRFITLGYKSRRKIVTMDKGFQYRSAEFVLADGSKWTGIVGISPADGGELCDGMIYLPDENTIADFSKAEDMLGKTKDEVFPIKYRYYNWRDNYDHHIDQRTGWSL